MQVQNVTAAYIMKCDDDTFVRVDTVLKEIEGISSKKSLYMGNLNLLHRPLRSGKWAVTYEVCKLAWIPTCLSHPFICFCSIVVFDELSCGFSECLDLSV